MLKYHVAKKFIVLNNNNEKKLVNENLWVNSLQECYESIKSFIDCYKTFNENATLIYFNVDKVEIW